MSFIPPLAIGSVISNKQLSAMFKVGNMGARGRLILKRSRDGRLITTSIMRDTKGQGYYTVRCLRKVRHGYDIIYYDCFIDRPCRRCADRIRADV